MKNEPLLNWIKKFLSWSLKEQVFWVTVLTAIAYVISSEYERGYMDYFGSSIFYETNLSNLPPTIFFIMSMSLMSILLYDFFRDRPEHRYWYYLMFLGFILILYNHSIIPLTSTTWFILIGVHVSTIVFLILIANTHWKNIVISNIYKPLLYIGVLLGMITIVVLTLSYIPFHYGNFQASEKEVFYVITCPEKERGNIIINKYKDSFVVAPLINQSILSSEIHLVKQETVRIQEKKIGPLKVQ